LNPSILSQETIAIILAAGKGTRMKSKIPKVLHHLMGKPIISYVITACKKAHVKKMILIVGYQADLVRNTLGPDFEYIEQKEQKGTGHALMMTTNILQNYKGDILVLAGDTPFLTGQILKKLIQHHKNTSAAATLMTANIDPPPAYGRIIRDETGRLIRIVEERDASIEEKKITEVNTSHYCFKAHKVLPLLSRLNTQNDQGEYYLTDIIELIIKEQEKVETLTSKDPDILIGINNRIHLAESNKMLGEKIKERWINNGITIIDPSSVYIESDVKIGQDTVIYPFSYISGKTIIERNCKIGPQVKLVNTRVGENCSIEFSVIENRKIEKNSTIGPFAYIS
jgi:bifunctional UDP-N-acetylglucosamine pyrophosphorylase/glucosamine-1-phosphate N-acetyltransferase